jgi:hypothetical protein
MKFHLARHDTMLCEVESGVPRSMTTSAFGVSVLMRRSLHEFNCQAATAPTSRSSLTLVARLGNR